MVVTSKGLGESLEPVWVAFPHIPWGSIGWRMGAGEHYWYTWMPWYRGLSLEERGQYKVVWPEPEGWTDFYRFVETGRKPKWAQLTSEGSTDA
jgi:hypothetical protein